MSQNVNVNLVPGNYPKEFHVSQYDVGRQLVANIVDSTGAYSIPSGATVTLVGTKPSGFGFTLSGSVGSGGVVTFSTTATVTAEYGRIPCEIRIESGNTVLGTANCMLIVEMSPHPEGTTDGDGEVIVNQITLLLEQITQQADRAVAASEAAQASETAAAASEANAASSESNAAASEATALSAKDDAVAAKTAAQASEQAAAESAAEAEATLGSYAKVSGEYDGMTVGTAKQLLSDSTTTDTEPYIYRQTAGDGDREEVEEVVGGTVAWNQLLPDGTRANTDNGISYTRATSAPYILNGTATANAVFLLNVSNLQAIKNHKYLFYGGKSTNVYLQLTTVVVWGGEANPQDVGAGKIANATQDGEYGFALIVKSGTTVTNESVNPQLFDLTAMFGTTIADYIYSLEQATAGAGVAWFKKLFPKPYYAYNAGELISVQASSHDTVGFNAWDEEWENGAISASTGNPSTNANYSRSKNFCPILPNTSYYRGAATVSNLGMFWYDADKKYIGVNYYAAPQVFTTPSNAHYFKVHWEGTSYSNDICINLSDPTRNGEYEPYQKHSYPLDSSLTLRGVPKLVDGKLAFDGDVYPPSGEVQRRYGLRAYQSGDESLTDAITDGTNTVYKLATPTTETADPYTAIQVCDPNGTEEWTDERTVQIPVGNVTKYHANLKEKLEDLPAIPSAPSANGTYTLKATVSGGAVTYQWVNG